MIEITYSQRELNERNFQKIIFSRSLFTVMFAIALDLICVFTPGQSSLNFIYNLVEAHEGAHGDYSLKEGRPLSGQTTLLIILIFTFTVCTILLQYMLH